MKMMRFGCQWMLGFMMMCMSAHALADGWSSYKSRFLQPDGRIIDTANHNVSHTEGQGYGMLLAVANHDRPTFDLLWQWTRTHLRNADNGLFYWRYTPEAADPVADKNNASDGDVLIAWALQRAARQWGGEYQAASDAIQRAILAHNVTTYAGYRVMLPGAQGFNKTDYVVLNPSYFLFAAWQAFAEHGQPREWNRLIADGMALLGKMQFGKIHLPLDWVALNADGTISPAADYSSRFSYDAIRVPLNVWWYDPRSPQLAPFQQLWQGYGRDNTPAWFDVLKNTVAPYPLSGGLLAVRDLVLSESGYLSDRLTPDQDYFSASLQLLTWMAYQEN